MYWNNFITPDFDRFWMANGLCNWGSFLLRKNNEILPHFAVILY